MESIKQLARVQVLVVRQSSEGSNKQEQSINCSDIVPGDVIIVRSGQKIPSDLRIIKANNLKVDNSSLTVKSH